MYSCDYTSGERKLRVDSRDNMTPRVEETTTAHHNVNDDNNTMMDPMEMENIHDDIEMQQGGQQYSFLPAAAGGGLRKSIIRREFVQEIAISATMSALPGIVRANDLLAVTRGPRPSEPSFSNDIVR